MRYKVIYCLIVPQIVEEANLFDTENIRMGGMASTVGSQPKLRRAVRQNGQQSDRDHLTYSCLGLVSCGCLLGLGRARVGGLFLRALQHHHGNVQMTAPTRVSLSCSEQ